MTSILFVFTSANKNLVGGQTGYYLPEAAHPYYVFTKAGISIDFASPKGPDITLDEGSAKLFAEDKECTEFLNDETVQKKFATAQKLSEVSADNYSAVFYVGGHGPVIDLPEDQINIKLATDFYTSGKLVSAVCHGPAALVNVKDQEGKSIFAGKRFTGFSNTEEEAVKAVNTIPFSLEDRIVSQGGKFEKAEKPFAVKVVVDPPIYTGQNPASAGPLAKEILKDLQK